jgi:hypothetical protein
VSFGSKLSPLPLHCSPGAEVIVTVEFIPDDEEFEREIEIYVEEPTGIRAMKFMVKSAS